MTDPGPRKQEILKRLGEKKQIKVLILKGAQVMMNKDTKTKELEGLRSGSREFPGGTSVQLEIDEMNSILIEIFTKLNKLGLKKNEILEAINGIIIEKELHRRENNPPGSRGTRR